MKKSIIIALCFLAAITSCRDYKRNPEQRTYESSYNSSSSATEPSDDPYYDNSLRTGASPYSNERRCSGDDSQIIVSTSSSSNCDVVVIIKNRGDIVRNTYLRAGASYSFDLPNGTYQVFFYGGKGWNPNKTMPNGEKGGFVANESYSKDSSVSLDYQILTYELIPQRNGNFSTQQSSASEIF